MTDWNKDEPFPVAPIRTNDERLKEGRVGQIVELIDALIRDHLALKEAHHQFRDEEHIKGHQDQVEHTKEAMKRLLEAFLL